TSGTAAEGDTDRDQERQQQKKAANPHYRYGEGLRRLADLQSVRPQRPTTALMFRPRLVGSLLEGGSNMKTKVAKIKIPVPARTESVDSIEEPTDDDLRAIEQDEERANQKTAGDTLTDVASTPVDLAHLGLNKIAYVRRAVVDAQPVWSIYSAS